MTSFLLSSVLVFAVVARVTRLVTVDQIFEWFRLWVFEKRPAGSPLTYLVFCQWCMSVWVGAIGAVVVVLLHPAPDVNVWVQGVGLAAAFSFGTGVLGEHYGARTDDEGGEA